MVILVVSIKIGGTLEDWNKYKSQYNTLFVDLEGTLVENTSSKFPPYIGNG